jgi:hypothetical protein
MPMLRLKLTHPPGMVVCMVDIAVIMDYGVDMD